MLYYEKALKIKSQDIITNYNLGLLFNELKQFQKSISFYEKVIKVDSKHIQSYHDLMDMFAQATHVAKMENVQSFLVEASEVPKLEDFISRSKNCIFAKIEKPDDELMFAILLKNFSDRQIDVDKKLIDFIIKHIDRSYGKIYEFVYKLDEISLKKKKSIDFKIIKEALKV